MSEPKNLLRIQLVGTFRAQIVSTTALDDADGYPRFDPDDIVEATIRMTAYDLFKFARLGYEQWFEITVHTAAIVDATDPEGGEA